MNIRVLKAESSKVGMAYAFFFFGFATYAYCGKWILQIAFWLVAWIFLICLEALFAPDSGIGFFGGLVALIVMAVCLIWPVHLFLSIPNLVKMSKLELYGIMAKTGQK